MAICTRILPTRANEKQNGWRNWKQFEKLPVKAPACEVLHKYRGVLLRLDVWTKLFKNELFVFTHCCT